MFNWCWIATAVSIRAYYEPATKWTLCVLANAKFPRRDCCNNPEACNESGRLSEALCEVGHLGEFLEHVLRPDEIRDQINACNPVCCYVHRGSDIWHVCAIVGYRFESADPASMHVMIKDPAHGDDEREYPYDGFLKGYEYGGVWKYTCTCDRRGKRCE